MKKTTKLLIASLALISSYSNQVFAITQTQIDKDATATATINGAITLKPTVGMSFGAITFTGTGPITINTASSVIKTNYTSSGSTNAQFDINNTNQTETSCEFIIPDKAYLNPVSGDAQSIEVKLSLADSLIGSETPPIPTKAKAGNSSFFVKGFATIPHTQAAGTYSGTYVVSIKY
jgi:hypothetical protein